MMDILAVVYIAGLVSVGFCLGAIWVLMRGH